MIKYRVFLVVSPTAVTSPNFKLKGIAGSTGRLDVIARSIIAALKTKNGIRGDTEFWGLLEGPPNPPILIKVIGSEVGYIPCSEIEVIKNLRNIMKGECIKGYILEKKGFKEVVKELMSRVSSLYYLRENGRKMSEETFRHERVGFILGSHVDLPPNYEEYLISLGVEKVSLSSMSYLTSQCIVIVHRILDRIHYLHRTLTPP